MEPFYENETNTNMSRQGMMYPQWPWWLIFPPNPPRPMPPYPYAPGPVIPAPLPRPMPYDPGVVIPYPPRPPYFSDMIGNQKDTTFD